MKVAVCFTGLCRGKYIRNVETHKVQFPDADFFFGTWEERKRDLKNLPISFTFPEPQMHYHPIFDNEFSFPDTTHDAQFRNDGYIKTLTPGHTKTLNGTKQILGHSLAVSQLSNEYDVVVRARYDVVVSARVNFQPFVERAYKNNETAGFGIFRMKPLYNFNKLQTSPHSYPALADWLIIHRRDALDIEYIQSLHNERKLLPVEWGWFQIFAPNILNVAGGVCLERSMSKHNARI